MERLNKQERHKLVREQLSQLAMRMSELFNWELDGEQTRTYRINLIMCSIDIYPQVCYNTRC